MTLISSGFLNDNNTECLGLLYYPITVSSTKGVLKILDSLVPIGL